MIEGLVNQNMSSKLYDTSRPAGNRHRKLLQKPQRSLSSPVTYRIRYLAARNQSPTDRRLRPIGVLSGLVNGSVTDQMCDVGNYPVVARLNEPVVIKARDIIFNQLHLFC